MAGDLYWDSVALALHMDDVGLTDVKGNAMTLNGGVTRSATQSKFGGFSAYFDGSDDEILNTTAMPTLGTSPVSAQFWCRPAAQAQTDAVVFSLRELLIEYKPTGYADGFVISANGTRTACGAFAEDAWHYIWITSDSTTATVYINGIFIATVALAYVYAETVWIGSNDIGSNPTTAFTGYVDDVLITPGITRTDYSVPVAAFPDTLPDPEGTASGVIQIVGVATGIVAPIGTGSGVIRIVASGEGSIPNNGRASAKVSVTGSGAGVVGRTGTGSCPIRIIGAATGAHGRYGVGSGAVRVRATATGKHGVAGIGSGSIVIAASATGSTPLVPVGVVSGVIRVTGNAYGLGAPVEEDACI